MEKIKNTLENLGLDLETITDPNIKIAITLLFNLIEEQASENQRLREENQKLRDENNILKGEQSKPNVKPSNKGGGGNISSEKERKGAGGGKGKKNRNRGSKRNRIRIDRTEVCKVDKSNLPADIKFKGYESVVVQDLKIVTDNINFKKEIYYSPSQNKTFRGELPTGYDGEFGPNIKALTVIMKYVCNTTEPKILEFFTNFNIHVSGAWISGILTKKQNTDIFHREKNAIFKAGLKSTRHQQIDETGARVNGENWSNHIVCNNFHTTFFTTKKKNRLTVLDILLNFKKRKYYLNSESLRLLELMTVQKGIRKKWSELHANNGKDTEYTSKEFKKILKEYFSNIGKIQKSRILEALGIAYYHNQTKFPIIDILICDDAREFKLLTKLLGLCWVHDGRHYKKLSPIVPHHITATKEFLEKYWNYYRELLAFKKDPKKEKATELSLEFDILFSTNTGYKKLDKRIAKTKTKKKELLLALKYPEIPLHNNEAELGARAQVRRRDASLQTITKEGTKANDTFLTIVQTAKKLKVSAYDFIFDRVSKKFELPSLSEIIAKKSNELKIVKIY